jgi:hypothetical protein
MKKVIFTLLVAFYAVSAFAQGSNYIFFAEQGEQFFVIINGIRQNEEPQTNVKVQNVNAMVLKVKIIFADKALGEVDKTLPVPEAPTEVTWNVRKDKNGAYVVKYFGEVPIAQAPPTPPTQTVITYHTTPAPAPVTSTTISTTTTTTGTNPNGDNVNVNVGIGVPGGGFGMNVNINDGTNFQQNTSVTSTTTTTTTTSTPAPAPTPVPAPNNDHYNMPGYNGPIGCPWPMNASDFASAKASIQKQSFSDTQFKIAQQIFNSNCLTSAQVKEIMLIFSFEETRLDFAKFAYGRTFDLGNYYKVNDAFTFSSSVDELNDYITGQ